MNPLQKLAEQGQSVWLDYIRRGMTRSGELSRMVDDDGLRGMTSNPAIFLKAITQSDDYHDVLKELIGSPTLDATQIFESLAVVDIQEAADVLRPVYTRTDRRDGYVSLEVSPSLAFDAQGTIEQARRLWTTVDRPNLMIKVPGTPPGLTAIERLIGEGINVNVTLIFARQAYQKVADAYLSGLEHYAASGGDLSGIASVASFFVSRIDTEVDARLQARWEQSDDASYRERLAALKGRAAVANAKLAYQIYQTIIASERWRALATVGARPQRLLWASTGTKNPAYSDVKYVQELCGDQTVNTIPPQTFDAFRDHGTPRPALIEHLDRAQPVLDELAEVGICLDEVTDQLLAQGIEQFEGAIDSLLATIAQMQRRQGGPRLNRLAYSLPSAMRERFDSAARQWDKDRNTTRLWEKDATLWTDQGEQHWLAWLDEIDAQRERQDIFSSLATQLADRTLTHALLIGMGGSSLGPDVLAHTFGDHVPKGSIELVIIDSTDPAQVQAVERSLPLETTLVIVSSKSGSTLEPAILLAHFFERIKQTVGPTLAGKHFIAITDPGSRLETFAKQQGFWRIFLGEPNIGGRFSVFSYFGLIPATVMGVDATALIDEAALMVDACRNQVADHNPGVQLGLLLGHAARQGRDKLTLVISPRIGLLGAWIEQLVAESTGKQGQALIPLHGEQLHDPAVYGEDRVFVYLRLRSTPDFAQDRAMAAIEAAGHPVVRIDMDDVDALGQEMFRWEIATAVAGSVMGINPFDQPDVESTKVETRAMMEAYERDGSLPSQTPFHHQLGLSLYTDETNATRLQASASTPADLATYLRAHWGDLQAGDYIALLAFIPMNDRNDHLLQRIRSLLLSHYHVATCVGFGPRFLHSTGQAYKGGPNRGVFLQLTGEDPCDIPVPNQRYSFGVVKAAQARGDFEVLAQRQRRVLRVDLGSDVESGLQTLLATLTTIVQKEDSNA